MSLGLGELDKVKEDLNKFTSIVDGIQNPRRKKFFEDLLHDYKSRIMSIDNSHNARIPGKIDPMSNRDDMEELIRIRNIFYSIKY